jgi:NADPH:quinone reductase-like Zn-dependent oxidoreductase
VRTVIHHAYGEPATVLQLTEAPQLPAPGPGEVAIRVHGRPVHRGDLLGIRGRYRAPGNHAPVGPDGLRPGTEGMGVIEAAGAAIDPARGLVTGARVAFFPARWTWSDSVLVAARFVTLVPGDIPDAAAAQLHVAPLTAMSLLRAVQDAGARVGDIVALSAAGSRVARLAAILLLERGYHPIGIVRSDAAQVALSMAMPEMGFVSTARADWSRRLCARVRGRPVPIALDAVGGAIGSTLASLLADGGRLVTYGDLSGEPLVLPALAFSARGFSLTGISVGRWSTLSDSMRRADIDDAIRLARAFPALFKPAAVYALEDVALAGQHAERPGKIGAVLLAAPP